MKLEIHYKPMTEKQYEQFIECLADFIEFCLKKQKEVNYGSGSKIQKEEKGEK